MTKREIYLDQCLRALSAKSRTAAAMVKVLDKKLPAKPAVIIPLDTLPDSVLRSMVEAFADIQCEAKVTALQAPVMALCAEYRRRNPAKPAGKTPEAA